MVKEDDCSLDWWDTGPRQESLEAIDTPEEHLPDYHFVALPRGYRFRRLLCEKSCAQVALATKRGEQFVVKQPRNNNFYGSHKIQNEYEKLKYLHGKTRYPNLPQPRTASMANGNSYIALDFIPGIDLSELSKQKHRDMDVVPLDVYLSVAETLGYVHANKILHKEVKPGNILLGDDGVVVEDKKTGTKRSIFNFKKLLRKP